MASRFQKLEERFAEMKTLEAQLSARERARKKPQEAQDLANTKLIVMQEANEKSWEKQFAELGESLQQRLNADVKLINDDMVGLAKSGNAVATQVETNQGRVDRELSKLTAEVANKSKSFQTQSSSLQDNLSKQIRSIRLEIEQEISQIAMSKSPQMTP